MIRIQNIFVFCEAVVKDYLKTEYHSILDNWLHVREAMRWLCRAQDSNKDDGVSEGYHLLHGWLPSYPETTGYIIETFFDYYRMTREELIKHRAIAMADWLVTIQGDDGSIPNSYFSKKMAFDTGQVIFGFVRAYEETGEEKYLKAAVRAGAWLVGVQEVDGSWRRYALAGIPHTYYTRVAWALARLHSIKKDGRLLDACIKNIRWAIGQQEQNGWFNSASFSSRDQKRPYTHTIAYTIEGILEAGLYLKEKIFIESATRCMDNLIKTISKDGAVFGAYDNNWNGDQRFSCLTGNAQLASILFRLYKETKNGEYLSHGKTINKYLKQKQALRVKNRDVYGALAGSHPVWGRYLHFTYPNWASKFLVDSLILEMNL